ncbi:TIGR03905 family TSCPD domain-containing protein [Clostridiaceae bacterium]|nr:TIGR03905 family TSCPD domain-containing protein [Clostridiaceae bacterium]RKI14092.1 TIGR03905 family TSCPD domain-containing protein [bacterium 1XD21-70]
MVYKTHGVCSREIHFEVKDHKLTNVRFIGGCPGNALGLSHLVEGMDISDVIRRLEGTRCGFKPTSCPDQLTLALKEYEKANPVSAEP